MGFLKKIQCDKCTRKFSKQEELMQHLQTVHYKDTQYDCKKCNKLFPSMEEMRDHLKKHHSYKKDRI